MFKDVGETIAYPVSKRIVELLYLFNVCNLNLVMYVLKKKSSNPDLVCAVVRGDHIFFFLTEMG